MSEWDTGLFYVRDGALDKGSIVEGHSHNYDHETVCIRGSMVIQLLRDDAEYEDREVDGVVERVETKPRSVEKEITLRAGTNRNSHALILAERSHSLVGLEDGTIYHCRYLHRDPEGRVVPRYDGWGAAYV